MEGSTADKTDCPSLSSELLELRYMFYSESDSEAVYLIKHQNYSEKVNIPPKTDIN